jgi:predicted component of type VI protein secretion system
MLNFEIGGNEVKIDASEAISAIPENRSLVIEQLTSEEPVNPEVVTGLTTIEQVFAHYKPQIDVEFQNEEGQSVKEAFHFNSVGDFAVKNLTEQSPFLKGVSTEKDFYDNLIKQLRSNKVLQRALENPETKEAFITALQAVATELNETENK